MNLSLVDSISGIFTLIPFVGILVLASRFLPLGPLSLPGVTALTGILYFYVMPLIVLANGDPGYFGMYINDLQWTHYGALLYIIGAASACYLFMSALAENPAKVRINERKYNNYIYVGLSIAAFLGIFLLSFTGQLHMFGAEANEFETSSKLLFLNEALSMAVPLSIVFVIRKNFKPSAWMIFLPIIFIFLQSGFRYRILILLFGVAASASLAWGLRIRIIHAVAGLCIGLMLFSFIGMIRHYGHGVDLSRFETASASGDDTTLVQVSGEFGIVYVFNSMAATPLPDPITIEPWTVAVSRLVPSVLWPNKPAADYLRHFTDQMENSENGVLAGVAAPQHVEMLLQFGWIGLPFLAFIYFCIILLVLKGVNKLGREARLCGFGLIPVYFGFYMQTRGYFFQMFTDALFYFGPLFLIHIKDSRQNVSARAGADPSSKTSGSRPLLAR